MRRLPLFALLILAALTSSCLSDNQKEKLHEVADVPITCDPGPDCEAKWRRAHDWINENSRFEIDRSSDTEIHTASGEGSNSPVLNVRKETNEDGDTVIVLDASCDNMLGCVPPLLQLQAAFTEYVNATPEDDSALNDADLGVTFAPPPKGQGKAGALKEEGKGLLITEVTPGSPAANAGLQAGDTLQRFNGRGVTSAAGVAEMVSATPSGSVLPVQVNRAGGIRVVYLRL